MNENIHVRMYGYSAIRYFCYSLSFVTMKYARIEEIKINLYIYTYIWKKLKPTKKRYQELNTHICTYKFRLRTYKIECILIR